MRNEILKQLEKNCKIDLNDLSIMLNSTPQILIDEIKAMENENIICGYHALINWDKTNDEKCSAFIEVKVMPQRAVGFDKIAERIMNYDEVNSVYLMAGNFDFLVLIEGKTMKEVSKFVFEKLSALESILSTTTVFVLKKYKSHGLILEKDLKTDKRMMVSF